MIKSDKIIYYQYNGDGEPINVVINFEGEQIINSIEESEMISFGKFRDNTEVANLIIVKDYIYAVLNTNFFCFLKLSEITLYPSQVFPIKCIDNFCYYIVGIINSDKELKLFLYKNPSTNCDGYSVNTFTINNIGTDNFSCQLMKSYSYQDILVCFYQIGNTNQIIADRLTIMISGDSSSINSLDTNPKILTNGIKIIKSSLSQDYKQALVCYICSENDCKCLTYNSYSNQWSDSTNYLSGCLSELSSLNIQYFDITQEYFLYCFQSSSKFNLQKLDSNYTKKESEENGIYDFTSSLSECDEYYIASLIHNSENINMFISCDNNIKFRQAIYYRVVPTTIITNILTTLPETTILTTIPETSILTALPETTILTTIPETSILTTLPETTIQTILPENSILTTLSETTILTILPKIAILSTLPFIESTLIDTQSTLNTIIISSIAVNENEIIIIQEKSAKAKEEIVEEIDEIIKKYDIGKIYEIFGEDYNIKISPINIRDHGNISTYIEFANCENILREKNKLNSSSILTVFQIEIENNNEKSLINDVEYSVYNEKKEKLDLSVCENELIEINYQINNSKINTSKIEYYSDLGIDVFNIKDQFFNDICYPYSEGGSDIILNDRVSDIYQNFSICENNCNYNKINLTESLVSCKCSIKTSVKSEVHPPKLDRIIRDSFVDSNFAVIKCFNLVFSFKNKYKNFGFLIFTFLSLLHLPFFIHYFIYKISSISSFIYREMKKFNYSNDKIKPKNPPKKGTIKKRNKNFKLSSIFSKYKNDKEELVSGKNNLKEKLKENTSSRLNLHKRETKRLKSKAQLNLKDNMLLIF